MTGRPGPTIRAGHREAWLEIDLDALRHNVAVLAELVGPLAGVAPVVKAEAYGHGLDAAASALADSVDALCVATLDEALRLRRRGHGRVIVLYPVPAFAAADAIAARVELTIMDRDDLRHLQAAADRVMPRAGAERVPIALQLCVETGMGRGGLPVAEVAAVADAARADARFVLAGLWTHLASPHDAHASRQQVDAFERARAALRAAGLDLPPRHVASSSGIVCGTAPALEMVRPGLAVYGVLDADLPLASTALAATERLRPAMTLKARPVAFVELPTGGRVGYGGRWEAARPSRIAILPLGYGDGYLRTTHPDACVLVRGRRLPVVGVISMDGVAVDVTDIPGVARDEEFVLLGRQQHEILGAVELARWRNTIPWEVLSGMAPRLDRVYYPRAGAVERGEPAAPNR